MSQTTDAVLRETVRAEVERQRPGLGFVIGDSYRSEAGEITCLLATRLGLDDDPTKDMYAYMQFKADDDAACTTDEVATEARGGVEKWLKHIDDEQEKVK